MLSRLIPVMPKVSLESLSSSLTMIAAAMFEMRANTGRLFERYGEVEIIVASDMLSIPYTMITARLRVA